MTDLTQLTDEQIEEAQKRLEEANAIEAQKQANTILKKHRREIDRLNTHAQGAVLENNFEAYKYAITKLRGIYRQPVTDELIVVMWETTRKQIWEIINGLSK
jgi:TolA-binding protein